MRPTTVHRTVNRRIGIERPWSGSGMVDGCRTCPRASWCPATLSCSGGLLPADLRLTKSWLEKWSIRRRSEGPAVHPPNGPPAPHQIRARCRWAGDLHPPPGG